MRELFQKKRFTPEALDMIAKSNAILQRYKEQGYDLSLRQLYYQFVAQNGFPEERKWTRLTNGKWVKDEAGTMNAEPNYKWLGDVVSDARIAGLMDWAMIKDRGRETIFPPHWTSPSQIIRAAAQQYRINLWDSQPYHVEVMVEKQALEGVLIPVCDRADVRFTANKGYSSSSALYETGKRLEAMRDEGKRPVIIYLGDHDPSGLDMSRDIQDRLQMFSRGGVEVNRVALNMDQIEELQPPENPAKLTDSRAAAYVAEYGESSWELDAIEPAQLAELVWRAVLNYRDEDEWEGAMREQKGMRADMKAMADKYDSENGIEPDEAQDDEEGNE